MRYNLESTLPINAFSPRGGRSPFARGMTLEGGGGGGGVFSGITDGISNVLGTAGGESGILGGLANFDKGVSKSVPGGWGGLAEMATIIAASSIPVVGPFAAAGLRGVYSYTHGGEDRKNAFRNAGEQLVTSYAGQYGGPLGAGAANAGLQYTHGGADRQNAVQSGLTTAAMSAAMNGIMNGARTDGGAPVTDNSDYGYSSDVSFDSAPAPSTDLTPTVAPSAPVSESPTFESPDVFDDGYSPNLNPDYAPVPGEPNFSITPSVEPYLGALPTSNIPTDMTPGTQFEGPNGTEIVAPNGKTYLMKDLESALTNLNQPVAPQAAPTETLTSVSDTAPKTIVQPTDTVTPQAKLDPEQVFRSLAETPYDSGAFNPAEYNAADKEFFKYNEPLTPEKIAENNAFAQKQADTSTLTRLSQMPGYAYDAALRDPATTALIGLAALNTMQGGQQPQENPASSDPTSDKYTGGYGSAGTTSSPYSLRQRLNAQNIYGYSSPTSRYAGGGEVKHFGVGGLSNAITRFTQPVEKAIVQPIGNAVPFLREAAPYAGLIAAPFIASPAMAAGVGALSSGFGQPGSGFNMKRAMMGGIAAYGMSNIGAGIEAAGTTPAMADTGAGFTTGSMDAALNTPNTASTGFFRDPEAMSAGVKNLAGGSTYNQAASQFATRAGLPSAGMAVMGTSGVMAVDEGIQQQKAADQAASTAQGENQELLNRIAAGKKRAQEAVKSNPYMYAMGGSVDDEYGMDEARGLNQGNLQNGFMGGGMPSYADGGMIPSYDLALRGLSQPAFNEGAVGGMQRFASGGDVQHYLFGGNISAIGPSISQSVESMLAEKAAADEAAVQAAQAEAARAEAGRVAMVGKEPYLVKNPLSDQQNPDPLSALNVFDYMSKDKRKGYAAGGTPRFLSGGGDGMSDSIPATIEGNQEARLADGEFVIPADVVSHLGNGSSKAGAKQLYSMMDRVRQARVGTKKQGREIKPKKFMPA